MNAPQQYERFKIPPGRKKVEVVADTKVQNAATFTMMGEEHTIGNVVRMCVRDRPLRRRTRFTFSFLTDVSPLPTSPPAGSSSLMRTSSSWGTRFRTLSCTR